MPPSVISSPKKPIKIYPIKHQNLYQKIQAHGINNLFSMIMDHKIITILQKNLRIDLLHIDLKKIYFTRIIFQKTIKYMNKIGINLIKEYGKAKQFKIDRKNNNLNHSMKITTNSQLLKIGIININLINLKDNLIDKIMLDNNNYRNFFMMDPKHTVKVKHNQNSITINFLETTICHIIIFIHILIRIHNHCTLLLISSHFHIHPRIHKFLKDFNWQNK